MQFMLKQWKKIEGELWPNLGQSRRSGLSIIGCGLINPSIKRSMKSRRRRRRRSRRRMGVAMRKRRRKARKSRGQDVGGPIWG